MTMETVNNLSSQTNSSSEINNSHVEDFWNNIYSHSPTHFPDDDDEVLSTALKHFGDIQGARLLDLGCGYGSSSLYFARKGANVTSVDISEVAINNIAQFCAEHQITNITGVKASAFDIAQLGEFDFVFGNLILHHLEPFGDFAKVLRQTVKPGGKAFFHENNAFSRVLVWFRENIVGKYGIPKYGDNEEFPLTPQEVDELKKYFSVNLEYPELVFFGLASVYLFKGGFHPPMQALDKFLYQYPTFRKYSYRQYLMLE
ncbi:class I SAM-dependent methyltransferase [Calothrix sp. 336/3]|uniref:class I SAM-dependent methyltransferase n=1 Tax=Calothrix sp. 336/3 TaxID=1337936 RepID=UPI00069B8817|nr:class I SAM-dependent methyltransferase [Calothrix sp. 336/3]